jgi:hypothetical protein
LNIRGEEQPMELQLTDRCTVRRASIIQRRKRAALLAAAAAAASMPLFWRPVAAAAAPRSYIGPSGSWNSATNWVGLAIPSAGDDATLNTSSGAPPIVVTFDGNYAAPLNSLTLDGLGANTVSLLQTANNQMFANAEYVGFTGMGVYTQNNGTNVSANGLVMGQNFGSFGTYTLGAGATLSDAVEYVGGFGNGSFTQNGGSHSVAGFLFVGYGATGANASSGTFTLAGGALSAGQEQIGRQGPGTFTQSGGANTTATLYIGSYDGAHFAAGSYTLNGATATLTVTGNAYVGHQGPGTFNQSGGTANLANLYLGYGTNAGAAPASGTFTLSAGALNVSGAADIGVVGTGTFIQDGGSAMFTAGLSLNAIGATYTLNNGSLSVPGEAITGTFIQSGGTHTVGSVGVGVGYGAGGTFTLFGGSLNSTGLRVGTTGPGFFHQIGGSNVLGDFGLVVGVSSFASNLYQLDGGTLNASGEQIGDGNGFGLSGSGTFIQNGGSHTVGTLYVCAGGFSGSGTFSLTGGVLSAGTVQLNTGGVFNQSGGTLSYGTFNMFAGTVTGTLQNQGTFNYSAGNFAGRLLNQGLLNLGPTFTAGNGMENDAPLTIGSGQAITLNGAGLDNAGSITLAGGTLVLSATAVNLNRGGFNLSPAIPFQLGVAALRNTGSLFLNGSLLNDGNVTNAAGGVIVGPGTINSPLTNSGGGTLLVKSGPLSILQPFTSGGMIQLADVTANLSGAPVLNIGTIQGIGTVGNAIANTGTIEPVGGILTLSGNLDNQPGGTLASAAGNKLLLTQPATLLNHGTISLAGGTFDTNGQPLANGDGFAGAGYSNGSISGYGILRTGGLTNAAGSSIVLTGGFTTINGPVLNAAGATIRAALSPVLFAGNLINNGTLKVTGAPTNTVTIAGTYSGNGSYISDPADNYFQSDVNIAAGGNLQGAAGDHFFIAGIYTNGGTYLNNGGTLSAHDVANHGTFNQVAGQATLNALSGTGSTLVGGNAAGTAGVSVSSLSQSSLTINSGGTLTIRSAAQRLTNSVANLQINGSGTLDLTKHELLTNTAPATIKSYLTSAYDPSGNADWNQPGLTSSIAIADPNKYSLAYGYGGDTSAQDAGVTTLTGTPLAGNQTVIRAVLAGDANMDGGVDFFDLSQLLGYKYNTGQPASYTDGDLNYDGVVDFFDLTVVLSANYNTGVTFAESTAQATPAATEFAAVPEPSGLTLSLLGVAGLSARRRCRQPMRLRQPIPGEVP